MEWLLIGLVLLIFFRPILMLFVWVGTFILFLFGLLLGVAGLFLTVILGKERSQIRVFKGTRFQWPGFGAQGREPKNSAGRDVIDVEVKRVINEEGASEEKPPADSELSTGGH